jgi:heme A synthase
VNNVDEARMGSRTTTVWVRVLAVSTLVATYALLVLGSTVRVTDSGMGCRGWPLCSGQAAPIDQFHPLMEQAHRFLATLVTVLIVTLAVVAWRAGAIATRVRGPAMASVGLIIVQIVLGAVTVVTNNAPVTVALHLLVATLFLGVVTLCAVSSFLEPSRTWSWRRPGRLAWSALGALYFVIISGSVVVDGGAQSACPSWPLCQSSHSPFGLVAIQFAHRSMVLVGSILVVCFMWNVLHSPFVVRIQRRLASVALILLVLQIAAGGISALDRARAAAADVHLALASALWTVVVALFCLCMRGPEPVTMSNDIVRAPTNAWR